MISLRKFYWRLVRSLIFLLTISSGPTLYAESKETIRVAVNPFPPWIIVENETVIGGIDTLIVKRIAKELNLTPHFILCSFAECLNQLKSGTADSMVSLFFKPEREAYAVYVRTHLTENSPKIFYLRGNDERDVKTYQDLQIKKIGFVEYTAYFERFDNDKTLNKLPFGNDKILITKLLEGEVDTFVGTESVIDYWLAKSGRANELKKSSFVYPSNRLTYMVISKHSSLMTRYSEIDDVVRKLKTSGEIDKVIASFWTQKRSTLAESPSP